MTACLSGHMATILMSPLKLQPLLNVQSNLGMEDVKYGVIESDPKIPNYDCIWRLSFLT